MFLSIGMLKQKYFLTDIFILSAEKQPIKLSWRKIEWLHIRSSVTIGSHVIIGAGTEIITTSHNIDSPDWTLKNYGITIEDYVWIPTNVLILPSCRNISYGSVIGSGSVVVKNTDPMSVVGGNPAKELRKRKCVHSNLIVESLLGGDYDIYKKTRKKRHC